MKLRVKGDYVMFHCVACKHAHVVPHQNNPKCQWSWNGNTEKPTLTPSLKISSMANAELKLPELTICHLNVTDGMIQYHSDSVHEFKGRTIPMVDWTD